MFPDHPLALRRLAQALGLRPSARLRAGRVRSARPSRSSLTEDLSLLRAGGPGRLLAAKPLVASRHFGCFGGECELYAVDVAARDLDSAVDWTLRQHERFTRFDERSELSRLNAHAGGWRQVSPDLEAMLRAGLDAYDRTDGLVHIGVLGAVQATGYTRTFRDGPTAAWETVSPPPLPDLLEVRPGEARLAAGEGVDLGGIAKGWLADRLAADLGPNCLVNFAGDLYAHGGGPDGEGWPVGFGDRTVLLHDMGAATSGTTKRRWGDGLHHLIDPRTGSPSVSLLREVSILATSALEAEILAKAALLRGGGAEAWLAGRALGWHLA